jgi:hypothetical protein
MANKMTSVAANLKPGQPVQSKEDFRRLFEDNATGKPTKMLNLTDSSSSSDGESTTAKQNLQQVESYIKKHQIKVRRQDPNQPFSNPQGGVTKEQIESLKRQAAEYGKKSSDDENEQQRDLTFDQLEEKRAQRAKKAKSLAAQFSIDLNSDKTRKILADRTADGVADEVLCLIYIK